MEYYKKGGQLISELDPTKPIASGGDGGSLIKITLTYSDSFAGRDYFMEIKYPFALTLVQRDQWFKLNDQPTHGGDDSEKTAREVAKTILKEKFPEIVVDIDQIPFKWNGSL